MNITPDNGLAHLGARINEAQRLAIEHAGNAIEQAIACGQMLLEAKARVPHGKWLPWLRDNITFGERSAQGYMRVAKRVPPQIRNGVSDFPSLRTALHALARPRRHMREAFDAEWRALSAHVDALRAKSPDNPKDWTVEDAKACANNIRAMDMLRHRHGLCVQESCLICDALGLNGPGYLPPRWVREWAERTLMIEETAKFTQGDGNDNA
jgi:hypothetical protein